ncbi:hypothetical protein J3R83DRAFT_4766 [Lanmaoa asiatica]|nr:hypothetical protein J3R83DRAFT_4766 [Lanmaoa asiatica]
MHNAFLVIRTVFFALLMYFHVLILVFASWNIVATKSSGMSAPGASVFLIMSSILIFMLVPMSYLAELICAKARPAHVRIECAWTALMSIFQLAATIDVTVNGPPMYCQMHFGWPHSSTYGSPPYLTFRGSVQMLKRRLPWPPHIHLHRSTRKPRPSSSSSSEASCAISKYIAERWEKLSRTERQPVSSGPILFTRGRQSVDSTRPAWARLQVTRRGIDNPFARPLPKRREPPVLLAPPPRTHSRQVVTLRDSRFMEISERPEMTKTRSYSTLTPQTPTVFPRRISNPDLPIPRPSRSEWIRADAVRGVTVYTEPIPSL